MASPGPIRRFLNRMPGVSGTAESEVDLVLPRDNPQKAPIAALYPTLFSIEATAQEQSLSDGEERFLLGIKSINWGSEIQEPKQLRWMHLSHEDIQFETFARRALEAYGFGKHVEAVVMSKFFDHLLSSFERSSFQGKRFRTDHASMDVELPGHAEGIKVNFMAIPYFLLQKARKRNGFHRSKLHWVQPLVQSAYHLDSSFARENQQAIRRLHSHISDIIHVPQVWVLNIGDKFIATCSPTPLYDNQRSSIATCAIGRDPFPPTIRVTMSSGFVFCLGRDQCDVWFKFLYRVQRTVKACLNVDIDQRNCVFRLQNDGSLIDARRWPSTLQSHSNNEPLLILASPGKSESSRRLPITIPLEGKYSSDSSKSDTTEYPRASIEVLSLKTLDEYKLPYYWDSPKPGAQKGLIIARHLTELDREILYNHTRRLRAMEDSNCPPRKRPEDIENIEDPYYTPPTYVMDAAKSQVETENIMSQGLQQSNLHRTTDDGAHMAGKKSQPIFKWSIKKDTPNADLGAHDALDCRPPRDRAVNKSSDQHKVSSADEPTPTQRMKSLLAHIHREILFNTERRSAKNYNKLPLKTKSDVDEQITRFRESHHVNSHMLVLMSSFVRRVSHILEHFIDKDYDCIVKGKVWAAVHVMILTIRFPSSDVLFSFHCEIFSIPLGKFMDQIQELRDGLSGSEDFHITHFMVRAFVQIVLLLADSSSEASRLMKSIESDSERNNQINHDNNPSAPTQSKDESGNTQEPDKEPESPRSNFGRPDIRDDIKETDNTTPSVEKQSTRKTQSSKSTAALGGRDNDFFSDANRHIDQIFAYLDQAQHECCAMFRSEDDVESSYNGVDSGNIIALVMDSVLRGHSTCESMPILDIEEIYATYTTSLQLQARNRPSKSLLVDINLLREELEIITDNIDKQLDLINGLCEDAEGLDFEDNTSPMVFEWLYSATPEGDAVINTSTRKVLREMQAGLRERWNVFEELTKRVDRLERQIVQRVDIIQEDHGKAVLIFTIVSTIFLPLSFVSSYLGMNTADIRNMELNQALFWQVAAPFTVAIVTVVLTVAYNANRILGWLPLGPTPAFP